MPKTPGKMHMYDMVKIDHIIFDIVKPPPPPRIVSCLKLPGSDRVNIISLIASTILTIYHIKLTTVCINIVFSLGYYAHYIANIMKMTKMYYLYIPMDSRVKIVRLLNNIIVIAK